MSFFFHTTSRFFSTDSKTSQSCSQLRKVMKFKLF
eukprot:UN19048